MRVVLYLVFSCSLSTLAFSEPVDFATGVHPILVARCLGCHVGAKAAADLSLGSRADMLKGGRGGPALKPGDASGSLIYKRITGEAGARMPLGGQPLNKDEIAAIRAWIDEGAKIDLPDAAIGTFSLSLRP